MKDHVFELVRKIIMKKKIGNTLNYTSINNFYYKFLMLWNVPGYSSSAKKFVLTTYLCIGQVLLILV